MILFRKFNFLLLTPCNCAASKGGIVSLARSVARSFGKQNIKSFIISPGFTHTKMAAKFIENHGEERILNEIAL